MKVKSFSGRTVAEALAQVREHLGEDALIIETRALRERGAFGRRIGYEVIAAHDPGRGTADDQRVGRGGQDWRRELLGQPASDPPAAPAGTPRRLPAPLSRLRPDSDTPGSPEPPAPTPAVAMPPPATDGLGRELTAIRRQLARLFTGERLVTERLGSERLTALEGSGLPAEFIAELDEILGRAGDRLLPERHDEFLVRYLAQQLPNDGGMDWDGCRHLLLVGPTGVGKTTTIAKLAGDLVLNRKRRVALVTLDTYRIGAPEQLRAYAELLDIPFLVARGPTQLAEALAGLSDQDNVLIDTAGRNPEDTARLQELRDCCRSVPGLGVMLAVAATSASAEFACAVERFSLLPIEHAVVTKLDENREPGRLYGCLRRHRLPLDYVTFGQEVPTDIAAFDPGRLGRQVLGHHAGHMEPA